MGWGRPPGGTRPAPVTNARRNANTFSTSLKAGPTKETVCPLEDVTALEGHIDATVTAAEANIDQTVQDTRRDLLTAIADLKAGFDAYVAKHP